MTDTPLTAAACEECLDRRWGSVHGEMCPHHPLSPWESTQREIEGYRQALEHWICGAHRIGEQGEHQAGNPDCDYARRALGQI